MASSGSVAMAIPGNSQATPHRPSGRARRRLRSVVDGVGALVVRRRPPSWPLPGLGFEPGGGSLAARLAALGDPAGADPHQVPARPGPIDKPAAVAHYQAMAERVAHERALAELDSRRRALSERASVSRELWVARVGPRTNDDPRHG